MFLDPTEDCPDKLVWALIGWLAWEKRPEYYRDALTELRDLLEFVFENMPSEEAQEERRVRENADAELLKRTKAEQLTQNLTQNRVSADGKIENQN